MVESDHTANHENNWMSCDESSSCSSIVGVSDNDFSERLLRNQEVAMTGNVVMDGLSNQAQFELQSRKRDGINVANSSNFATNALSAAGAAVLSAIIVNPLDVAKTRLQAQAAGAQHAHPLSNAMGRMGYFGPTMMFADLRCSPSCARAGFQGTVSICPPDCFQYKGTLDVLYKIVRQEGIARLWRGTNAGLALAIPMVGIYMPFYDVFRIRMEQLADEHAPNVKPYVPFVAGALARSLACTTCYPIELARTRMQAFKEVGKKPPGVMKTLLGVVSNSSTSFNSNLQNMRFLWTGLGAQLARDVPYSAICCPLDVARTRRQIEKDPIRALRMTTRETLKEIWRDGGMKGLFTGVGPRVARAGPSVGIVVSFYEVVKYVLNTRAVLD